jgi:hypothetical protein
MFCELSAKRSGAGFLPRRNQVHSFRPPPCRYPRPATRTPLSPPSTKASRATHNTKEIAPIETAALRQRSPGIGSVTDSLSDIWPRGGRRGRHPAHTRPFSTRTTPHPAIIPHEPAGSSRKSPAIPATARAKRPAHRGNPRLFPLRPQAPRPACHAGGRGFESRRSRKNPCKTACFCCHARAIDRRLPRSRIHPARKCRHEAGPIASQ